jgi:hypothetical protein
MIRSERDNLGWISRYVKLFLLWNRLANEDYLSTWKKNSEFYKEK